MATQIQIRRDTAANWTSANPTLASGEIGFETDQNKFKIGTGSTDYANLAYAGGGDIGNAITDVNSITSETSTTLTLTGQNELLLNAAGGDMMVQVQGQNHTAFFNDSGTLRQNLFGSGDYALTRVNEGNVNIDIGGNTIMRTFVVDGEGQGVIIDGGLEAPSIGSAGTIRGAQLARGVNTNSNTLGNIDINGSGGTFAYITLSGDFGISSITNVPQGASGTVVLRVPANADIAADTTAFPLSDDFFYANGNASVFSDALPSGGTEAFDRYWKFDFHQLDTVESGSVIFLETPVGPISNP